MLSKKLRGDNLSISKPLYLIILPFLAIISFFIIFFGLNQVNRVDQQITEEHAKLFLSVVSKEGRQVFHESRTTLENWEKDISENNLLSNPCSSEVIKKTIGDERYTTYAVININGDFLCSEDSIDPNINISDSDNFKAAFSEKRFFIGNFAVGRISGEEIITLFYPVLSEDNQVTKILAIGLSLDWVSDLLQRVGLPSDGELILTDREGTIISYFPYNVKNVGTKVFDLDLFSIILSRKSGTLEAKGFDGIERFYIYDPVSIYKDSEIDMFLIFGIPKK